VRATFQDPELQATLEHDGYAVVPLLDADDVTRLRAAYERLGSAPGDPGMACHSSFHSYDPEYKQQVDEKIREVLDPHLARVFDRQRPLPCNFINKYPGGMGGFGLHQDLSLVDESEFRSVEVWIALEDTDATNGQLWMVPQSHTWLPTVRGIQSFPFSFGDASRRIIDRHARPVPVSAGTAIVFNHATLHFSFPNRSDHARLAAITDLIPEEAEHLHYFGDGDGNVDVYAIDEAFWVENNPFTLHKPPPASTRIGRVDFQPRQLTDEDLDRLVAEGRAIDVDFHPRGSINAGRRWCHRCGTTMEGEAADRWIGNITLLCDDCRQAEIAHAPSPAHVDA
jgi:Phytanoyl-CoA dioxygenase (PhyH)